MDVLTPFYNDRPEDERLSKLMSRDLLQHKKETWQEKEIRSSSDLVEYASKLHAITADQRLHPWHGQVFLLKQPTEIAIRGEHDWLALVEAWKRKPLCNREPDRGRGHVLRRQAKAINSAEIENINGKDVFCFTLKPDWYGTAIFDLTLLLQDEPLHVEMIYSGLPFGTFQVEKSGSLWEAKGLPYGFPLGCLWPRLIAIRILTVPRRPQLFCRLSWHEWTDGGDKPFLPIEWKRICVPIDEEFSLWLPDHELCPRVQHAPAMVDELGPRCSVCRDDLAKQNTDRVVREVPMTEEEVAIALRS